MGRQAHLLRLALGRSADLPPDWEAVSDQYERVEGDGNTAPHYRCIDSTNLLSYGKTFDEKGRPMDLRVYQLDEERCKAQNAVLALGVTQDAQQSTQDEARRSSNVPESSALQRPSDAIVLQWTTPAVLEIAFRYLRYTMIYPILTLQRRLMVYNFSGSISVLDYVSSGVKTQGFLPFAFAGFPAALLEILIELVLKDPMSRVSRGFNIGDTGSQSFILLVDILFMLPLSLFTKLQQLHLIPADQLFPAAATFVPWSRSSPLITRTRPDWWHPSAATSVFIYSRVADRVLSSLRTIFVTPIDLVQMFRAKAKKQDVMSTLLSRFGNRLIKILGWEKDQQFDGSHHYVFPLVGVARPLSRILGQLVLLPAQAIMCRVIAHSFLDHASTPSQQANAAMVRTSMFPILGPSLKGLTTLQGARSVGRYAANIGLCTGLYIAVELFQQAVQHAVAMRLVKRSQDQATRREID